MALADLCAECLHCVHHHPGSIRSVAEGHDDPYDYWFCAKGNWEDAPDEDAEARCHDVLYPRESRKKGE